MRIDVRADIRELTRGLTDLQRTVIPKATQQALNRVAPTVKTATVRALQARLKLRNQSGLRASIRVVKAQQGNLTAEVGTADRSIKMDETRNALVRVTRKRTIGGGSRKVTTVLFKGAKLDGVIQVTLSPLRSIRKKEGGRYSTGKRSQKIAPVYAYTQVQELIKAEIDREQERLGAQRFGIEFDRALAEGLRRLRL
jgi:Prophage minor tail protein Z (GPZ)